MPSSPNNSDHWQDHAISSAEDISDALDVATAYGAHVAGWVVFFCLVANILEMLTALQTDGYMMRSNKIPSLFIVFYMAFHS